MGSHHHHHHHHPDSHAPGSLGALVGVIVLTTVIFLAELVAGWLSGSLALLSDAMHMLSDSTGLILALVAMLVGRRAPTPQATYGYRRVEVLAALLNAITVTAVCVWIVIQAVARLHHQEPIDTGMMLIVAVIGLIANGASALILARRSGGSLNMRGAYLHVLSDLLGSVAVIAAGLVIAWTGFQAADTIASVLIACLVVPRSLGLVRASISVLLERAPADVDARAAARALERIPGVIAVHDLHIWTTDGSTVLASCHLVIDTETTTGCAVLDAAQRRLHDRGIQHSTIQVEHPGHRDHETVCH